MKRCNQALVALKQKSARVAAAGLSMALVAPAVFAQAAEDPGVVAINGLSAKATTYITAAFAVAVLVAGGFWGITMMKKAFGKAK